MIERILTGWTILAGAVNGVVGVYVAVESLYSGLLIILYSFMVLGLGVALVLESHSRSSPRFDGHRREAAVSVLTSGQDQANGPDKRAA